MGERLTESERAVFLEEISKSYTHGWNCARAELLPLLDAERQRGDDLEAALAARGAGDGLAGRVAALADEFRGRLPFAFERRLHRLLDPDAQGADGGGWGVSRPIIPTLEDLDFLPWMFGHPETKATGLWLKGLPPLIGTEDSRAYMDSLPIAERNRIHRMPQSRDRWKVRSTTFPGIAAAMAQQWGALEGLAAA